MWATNALKRLVPLRLQLPVRYYRNLMKGSLDPEMLWVDRHLKCRRRFVDIGANVGVYSFYFTRKFNSVDAFEPIEEVAQYIRPHCGRKLRLHTCALSDEVGELLLNIPVDQAGLPEYGLASLEPRKVNSVQRRVRLDRLDNYSFNDIDLIKIDVEGHERQVLRGGKRTIERCRPILIVEIEQRHLNVPIDVVFAEFQSEGYSGAFLSDGQELDISNFRFEEHQEPYLTGGPEIGYINNFIFFPRG